MGGDSQRVSSNAYYRYPSFFFAWFQAIRDSAFFRQLFIEGHGGGSKWASLHTFRKCSGKISRKLNNNRILLGRALFADDYKARIISADKESHLVTIAGTGAGKSVTSLYGNLSQWGSSAIIVDPKAELTHQTYRVRSGKAWLKQNNIKGKTRRHKKGDARCYLLDPFEENKDLPKACYNVLSEIDIHSPRVREMLSAISDGCVLPEKNDIHFRDMAQFAIEAFILFVLAKYPKENHNLPFVYDLITGIVDPDLPYADPTAFNSILKDMLKVHQAGGGLCQQFASKMLEVGDREGGSILTTVARSLKWCSDPAMRQHLTTSDFSFSELKKRTATIYIVLPSSLMEPQSRWLRVLISISLNITKKQEIDPKQPLLFVLDELPLLGGKIKAVADGFALLRGYGIRLWGLVQVLEQLKHDYPNYDAILGNATVQVYGINSLFTAEWISRMLGEGIQKKKIGKGEARHVQEYIRPLLTPSEVRIKLSRSANRSIVFSDGFPMRLERCSFKPMKISGNRFFEFAPFAFKGCFEDW